MSLTPPAAPRTPPTMRYRTFLLVGAPGSGKGTQGKALGTIPNYFHFACGDVFRSLKPDSELGRIFLDYSSRGLLVPDEFTVRLWRDRIQGAVQTGQFSPERDTLVLDGIPRNVHQAQMLEDALEVRAVLNLTCPDREKLVERMQRRALKDNRLDDANLEVIRDRIETYGRNTRPILDFYGETLVHTVNAALTPAEVLRDILAIVTAL